MKNVTYNMTETISHMSHIQLTFDWEMVFQVRVNAIKEISNINFYHNTNTKKVSLVFGKRFKLPDK